MTPTGSRGQVRGSHTVLRAGASSALLGAAVLHASVVVEHSEEWAPAGLFFVGLQAVETMLAVALWLRWSRGPAAAVVASSVGALAIWLVSRTTGLPLGPASFRVPEELGGTDLACAVLEVLAALLVLPALRRSRADAAPARTARDRSPSAGTLAVAGLLLTVVAVVTVAGLRHGAEDEHEHHGRAGGGPGDRRTVSQSSACTEGAIGCSPRKTRRTDSTSRSGAQSLSR